MRPTIESIKQDDGKLPHYAWPGGYPTVYMDSNGETLCAECANKPPEDSLSPVADWFIHYEGLPIICADCDKEIESAYGDPESED